jgi:hypothetical protein
MTSYSDTTPQKKVITDAIDIISPRDVPVVKYFGLDGDPGKFSMVNWPSTTVYWLEDTLTPLTTTLGSSLSKADTTAKVADATIFKKGDVIMIGTDKMWVSATNNATKITVVHDYDGSSTTHANSATVEIISNARLEGADADYGRGLTDVSQGYNYTQIFQDDFKITRTQDKIAQYGKPASEFDYQAAKKVPEMTRLIEKSFFLGVRASGSGTASARSFGGLETFVTDNTTSISGAAITRKDIEDCIQSCWDDGGNPDLIICNGWVKRKIDAMFEGFVRTERSEERGGVRISYLDTNYGPLMVLLSRWCPKTKLYVLESQYIGFLAYDPFFQEPMAKVGDDKRGQVVGEYTLVCKNDSAHGYISSISTTS